MSKLKPSTLKMLMLLVALFPTLACSIPVAAQESETEVECWKKPYPENLDCPVSTPNQPGGTTWIPGFPTDENDIGLQYENDPRRFEKELHELNNENLFLPGQPL